MRQRHARTGLMIAIGWVLLAADASVVALSAQALDSSGSAANVFQHANAHPSSPEAASGEVYREINDPHTGDRWLLFRNLSHPGGPGRMVLAERPEGAPVGSAALRERVNGPVDAVEQLPVLHAGDEIVVSRATRTVDEQFEGVALGPAAKGALFEVRLKIGGKVFMAVASAPGRAVFAEEDGGRR